MELEETIEKLNYKKTIRDLKDYVKDNNCMLADAIDVVLKELEKKDKIINLMADDRLHLGRCIYLHNVFNIEDVIKFYENKANEEA